ncbi:Alcohol dehydrogenase-like 2 [Citrus sinensis]|nr:Alcohol dehydrogenase-like 2 [Citrus sinensis]
MPSSELVMDNKNASSTAGKIIRCRAAISRIPGKPLVMEEIEVDPPKAGEVRIKILCTSLCHSDVTFWRSTQATVQLWYRATIAPAVGSTQMSGVHLNKWKSNGWVQLWHGLGAAWKVAEVEEGSTVAIFGLGAVGLSVAEGARIRGATRIIGVDLNPEKFETGKKFGITDFINPATCGDKTVSQVIKEMTDGGADYCFECIGLASVMNDAFNSSREGWGKTVILGVEMHGSPISLNSIEILKGRSVCGTFFGGLKPKSDIATLAQKYLDKVHLHSSFHLCDPDSDSAGLLVFL